eukprot:CAMPEP_0171455264 /NCGR_PEP_ID=MMETSP0945-20130129/2231_1 /TAXON_ID=109269 /ORGANISM="Vaucheria litorea, Strain CCMP2940" /LENGTH=839 /DNA_ID=CAMNT_0011980475 /DNA_START=281 /DNA_END=2796 /DNA_ORIENTATION=-
MTCQRSAYFNVAPEPVAILNRDGIIIDVNERFQNQVASFERVSGLSFVDNLINEDEAPRFKSAIQNVISEAIGKSSSELSKIEVNVLRNAVTLILGNNLNNLPIYRRYDWAVSAFEEGENVILSGRMATVVDDQREAAENELIDFFNKAPIALHWLSSKGDILWANETEMNILGYTAEEYIGLNISDICPEETETFTEVFRQLSAGNTVRDIPVKGRTKSGEIVYFLIDSNVNFFPDNTFNHTRCFIRDDTSRKVREARLEALVESSNQIAMEKEAFILKIFNKIRGPCHIVIQALSLIEAALIDIKSSLPDNSVASPFIEDAEKLIEEGIREAERLALIVDDVADASSFESGLTMTTKSVPFEPRKLLDDIEKTVKELWPIKAGVTVSSIVQEKVPKVLEGDARLLGRALQSMLINGVKFTNEGEVCITLYPEVNDMYTFEVSDTGSGITETSLNVLFQKYWKSPNAREIEIPESIEEIKNKMLLSSQHCYSSSSSTVFMDSDFLQLNNMSTISCSDMEEGLEDKLELGLNVAYNIVQCLGGEIKVNSHTGGMTLMFTIRLGRAKNQIIDAPGLPAQVFKVTHLDDEQALPLLNNVVSLGSKIETEQIKATNATDQSSVEIAEASAKQTNKKAGMFKFNLPKFSFGMIKGGKRVRERLSSFNQLSEEGREYSWEPVIASDAADALFHKNMAHEKRGKDVDLKIGLKSARPPHILLVEDNTICQRVTQHYLRRLGCGCQIAGNGKIAIKELAYRSDIYDLIITDLRMPEMDGLQAAAYIRNKLNLDIPILGFSAESEDEVKDQCKAVGMQGFLSKPTTIDNLGAEISGLLPHLPINIPA